MMRFLIMLFALLREIKSVTITIKKLPPCRNQCGYSLKREIQSNLRLTVKVLPTDIIPVPLAYVNARAVFLSISRFLEALTAPAVWPEYTRGSPL